MLVEAAHTFTMSGDRAEVRFKGGTLAGDIDGDGSGGFHVALMDVARLASSDILV